MLRGLCAYGYRSRSNNLMQFVILTCLFVCFCRYYFPTFENDNLLCALDDDDDTDDVTPDAMLTRIVGTEPEVTEITGQIGDVSLGTAVSKNMSRDAKVTCRPPHMAGDNVSVSYVIAEEFPVRESMLSDSAVLQQLRRDT